MLTVLISWTVLFLVFLAFGEMAVTVWNTITKKNDSFSMTDKLWMGLCAVGTVLLYISLFAPVNVAVLLVLLSVALVFWGLKRDVLHLTIRKISHTAKTLSASEKAIFVAVFVIVLIYALSAPLIYDEGLYHLQTMQWTEKFGAVPGLGNLHGRLGFNSSFLLLSTLFNYHPSLYEPFFTINSFVLLIFSFWILGQIVRSRNIVKNTALAFILVASLFSLGTNVSSSSTDIVPNIFILYLLINRVLDKDYFASNTLPVFLIASFCITLKISSGIIFLCIIASLAVLIKNKTKTLTIVAAIAIGAIIALPWLIRFVILTGYLIYPLPGVDLFAVDWKIPPEMVALERDMAYAWGRIPDMEIEEVMKMGFTDWFPVWWSNQSLYKLVIYIAVLLSPALLILNPYAENRRNMIVPWGIAFCGVLFSLLTAPDFRFAFGFILSAAATPFLVTGNVLKLPHQKAVLNVTVLILSAGLIYMASAQARTYQPYSGIATAQLLVKPQPVNTLQKRDNITFDNYKINNTVIYVPRDANQCFDQDIPCLPYFSTNWEMRGDDIKNGFRIKK